MHILVVDDDQAVRDSLARSLTYSGDDVQTAADGVEALAKLVSYQPDAIIMDVMMPRLDGLETTRMLRQGGNDIPILILTARDAVGDRVDGLDAGADDYMVKPFALDELLARLRALTRRSKPAPEAESRVLTFQDVTLDTQHLPDAHRVRAAPGVHGEPPSRDGAQHAPERGVGVRVPDDGELARGLHRLPAPQD